MVNDDPVARRRARAARLAGWGRRAGYALLAGALGALAAGMAAGLSAPWVALSGACLVAGSLLLAPAIVVGYGVRAAEREDRRAGR
jgi:ABC-type microcin C transport system permease subunit YejE